MWRDVELRELRIFLVLADELHFGRTAERLGISQPGVSEAVRVLESRLGVKFFDRTSRRVRVEYPVMWSMVFCNSCAAASGMFIPLASSLLRMIVYLLDGVEQEGCRDLVGPGYR